MKTKKFILEITISVLLLSLCLFIGSKILDKYKEKKAYEDAKANFKLEVTLDDKLTISFGKDTNLKDYIKESNVTFEDKIMAYYELGEKKATLNYTDEYGRTGEYTFNITVIDDENPILMAPSSITAIKGSKANLLDGVMCADYASSNVKCEVEGEYDLNKLGEYKLNYKATDEAGNTVTKGFTLNVINKTSNTPSNPTYVSFKDIYNAHKTDKTLIGIDVSEWQDSIDFNKVREAGAEFVIIRLGVFYNNAHHLDEMYEENIRKAKAAGLKVGLYYYSEARTIEEAIACADFVASNIHYDLDLPIAYDWEDWSNFNSYKLSLYEFNKAGYAFLDHINEYGYDSMLYGSVNYLEKVWRPKDYTVWVAQYYKENQYDGKSFMWQLTSSGIIDGINGAVDIDILYLD